MGTLVRDDGLHRRRFADDATRGSDTVFLQITNQSAYPEAPDFLVIAQCVVQRRIQAAGIECGDELRRLIESAADEPLHVGRTPGEQLAVLFDGDERIRIPCLSVHRHHVRMSR